MILLYPFLGIYLKESKSAHNRNICIPIFATLFTVTKLWNQPRYSFTDEWIMKMRYIDIMDYY
jgi:hypothetical protein